MTRWAAGITRAGPWSAGAAGRGAGVVAGGRVLGSGVGALGAGAAAPSGLASAAPSSMSPITSPTLAGSPCFLRMRLTTPATGAGTSTVTLSVSISTSGSSFSTRWPSCLSHCAISTSVIDSPTLGTFSSTGMASILSRPIASARVACGPRRRRAGRPTIPTLPRPGRSFAPRSSPERRREPPLLLQSVHRLGPRRRTGRLGTVDAVEREAVQQPAAEPDLQVPPRPHVLRLLLHPERRGLVVVGGQGLAQRLHLQRVQLL